MDDERPPRTSRPPQARTRLARAAVVSAARTLFVEHGYGGTTIDAISTAADVPAPTVYRLFSSKLGILKALLDVAIVGDDADEAMADRPDVRAMIDEPDPRAMLSMFVGITTRLNPRVAPLYRILTSAAQFDRDAAALLDQLTEQRQTGQRQVARALARNGALHEGMDEGGAADIVHALMSPELYRLLVEDRGWPVERYRAWLTATLDAQLLPPVSDAERAPNPD